MLHFSRSESIFKILGALPLSTFTTDTVTLAQIAAMIVVGEDCDVLAFSNGATTGIYRASSDWTSINPVTLPANWNSQAASLDLEYGISNNHLYRYNRTTFSFDDVYTFPANQKYQILNSGRRVVIYSSNSSFVNNNTSPKTISTDFKIYVLHDQTGNQVTIGTIEVTNAI